MISSACACILSSSGVLRRSGGGGVPGTAAFVVLDFTSVWIERADVPYYGPEASLRGTDQFTPQKTHSYEKLKIGKIFQICTFGDRYVFAFYQKPCAITKVPGTLQ
jgi:hypothetical protein